MTNRQMPSLDAQWVVIPAYNEGVVIENTIRELSPFFKKFVVVDDCSRDDTADIALRAGAHVCRHPINLGQGAALQTGIHYALAKGAEVIITFDADGQHQPRDAQAMVETLIEGNHDIVLSSRFKGTAEGIPRLKYIVLVAAVWFTRLTTGLPVTDTHNGLRVFSRRAAEVVKIRQNRMAHASEILEEIARLKLSWTEVPGTIRYTAYSITKGQRLSGAVEILKDLFFRRLRS
jgi:glycosyltransferase involved in cell wall biosynthesis